MIAWTVDRARSIVIRSPPPRPAFYFYLFVLFLWDAFRSVSHEKSNDKICKRAAQVLARASKQGEARDHVEGAKVETFARERLISPQTAARTAQNLRHPLSVVVAVEKVDFLFRFVPQYLCAMI